MGEWAACVCVFEPVDVLAHVCESVCWCGKGVCMCVIEHVCVYERASVCAHTCAQRPSPIFFYYFLPGFDVVGE